MYRTIVFSVVLFATIVITFLATISYKRTQLRAEASKINTVRVSQTLMQGSTKSVPGTNSNYWFWLLPIFALPFLLLVFRVQDDDDLDNSWPYDQYSVGTKGGKSSDVNET